MKKFIAFVTHPVVISVIGLILLALLIWFAGPHIKFGEENTAPLASAVVRLMLIMALLIAWSWPDSALTLPFGEYSVQVSLVVLLGLVVILAGLVGMARLVLKVHVPRDLWQGYLVGFFSVWVASWVG